MLRNAPVHSSRASLHVKLLNTGSILAYLVASGCSGMNSPVSGTITYLLAFWTSNQNSIHSEHGIESKFSFPQVLVVMMDIFLLKTETVLLSWNVESTTQVSEAFFVMLIYRRCMYLMTCISQREYKTIWRHIEQHLVSDYWKVAFVRKKLLIPSG